MPDDDFLYPCDGACRDSGGYQTGDEIIMPSYTFVSTANAFVLRGGVPVFVDIRPDTMNIDEKQIEAAITEKTKAIVPVHYAGVACEMDTIMDIAKRHNLLVIEDAAQGVMASYKGKLSGASVIMAATASMKQKITAWGGRCTADPRSGACGACRDHPGKGTDRSKYFRGQVDKYRWQEFGSSYLPSELNVAYLYAQLEMADQINEARLARWNEYYKLLTPLAQTGRIELPVVRRAASIMPTCSISRRRTNTNARS